MRRQGLRQKWQLVQAHRNNPAAGRGPASRSSCARLELVSSAAAITIDLHEGGSALWQEMLESGVAGVADGKLDWEHAVSFFVVRKGLARELLLRAWVAIDTDGNPREARMGYMPRSIVVHNNLGC